MCLDELIENSKKIKILDILNTSFKYPAFFFFA